MECCCKLNGTSLYADDRGFVSIERDGCSWNSDRDFTATATLLDEEPVALFDKPCTPEHFKTGLGEGFRYTLNDLKRGNGTPLKLALRLLVWIEKTDGSIRFDVEALRDEEQLDVVRWPAPFAFEKGKSTAVIPSMQGMLLPDTWPKEVLPIEPPYFMERAAYMNWLGFLQGENGAIMIVDTPWDAGYDLRHPAGGPTRLNICWRSSLGKLRYTRSIMMRFSSGGGYVALCKIYRQYLKERGQLRTLKEKFLVHENAARLCGAPVIHTSILYNTVPEAQTYDPDGENYSFATFETRLKQLKKLYTRGIRGAYVHLDGWGKEGYDHLHPDILPPCEKAGGAEGLRSLSRGAKEQGYLFALHDQYRDYYVDAESFQEENALMDRKGKLPRECTWAGGEQRYLCATQAFDYVKRNYNELDTYGVDLDGAYLDVFSVIQLDECFNPSHPMTRRECAAYRAKCFDFIAYRYGIASSEEPIGFYVPHLTLCHHGPYSTAPTLARGEQRGIPVPILNLVYHDCILLPWNLSEGEASVHPNGRSGFLYALLNGGLGYLPIEPTDDEIQKCLKVSALNKLVGTSEMTSHEWIDGDLERQRTQFACGVSVEVDFRKNSYRVFNENGEDIALA